MKNVKNRVTQADFSSRDPQLGADNLKRFGITVHQGLLSPDKTAELRNTLEVQAAWERELGLCCYAYDSTGTVNNDNFLKPTIGKPSSEPGLQRVFFLVNKGRCFIDVAMNRMLQSYCKSLFNDMRYAVCTQYGMIIRSGVPAQPAHRAQHVLPFAVPIPLTLMVMIALSDQSKETGSTVVIPGSHEQDNINDAQSASPIPLSLSAGDAIVMDGRLLHGRGESNIDTPRINVAQMYAADFLKPADCYPALIQDHAYQSMSDDELQMYDFDASCGNRFSPRDEHDPRSNISAPLPFIPGMPT